MGTSKNRELWDRFGKTDPNYTKEFKKAGGFEGTAISPMWAVREMTSQFGPIGYGWGIEHHDLITREVGQEILVYALVSVWYLHEGQKCVAGPQWGGDKIASVGKSGLRTDDEALKKASTDGMMKCLSYIGLGSDIHLGMYDDSKYVNTLRKEFAEEKKKEASEEKKKETKPGPSEEDVKKYKENLSFAANKMAEGSGLSPDECRKTLIARLEEHNKDRKAEDKFNAAMDYLADYIQGKIA